MPEKITMPLIPLRGLTVFPRTIINFDIGREKSIKALEEAMKGDRLLFLASQKDESVLIPTPKDFYNVGTVVKVKQMLKMQGDTIRVLVDGKYRATIENIISDEPFYLVESLEAEIPKVDENDVEVEALKRVCGKEFSLYVDLNSDMKPEAKSVADQIDDPYIFADTICMQLDIEIEKKQQILEAFDIKERLALLNKLILEENEVLSLEQLIEDKVQTSVKNGQKEFLLKEQMKAIQEELGFTEEQAMEVEKWNEKLEELKLDENTEKKIRTELNRFAKMTPNSPDMAVSRNYIETVLDLPWHTSSKLNQDLKKAERILNDEHFGLDTVKERILEYLAVIHLSKKIKGPIICLVGPPGVGKTSIARSIANATGRKFVRMSLGGVRDEAEIRGHRRTYIGSIPGRVISLIKDCGTNNPVFLFDEVDKIGADYKGDPSDALLEVLDPEQNKDFTDHYLDVPFDLSNVMFITTANSIETIPRPLLDRMEVIELSGYTEEEKLEIAKRFLVPKQIRENGLKKRNLDISDKAIRDIINYYTRESGVRNLEREIGSLARKVARKIVTKKGTVFRITPSKLEDFLGKKKYFFDKVEGESEVGVVTGMAWTEVGGETLFVETQIMPGTGQIQLTGKLGDVMQESAKAAISYIRSISSEFNLKKDWHKESDIHIHVPEGAVPKDGPSAGVTMFTSLLSALTNTPVRKDVSMTGEITLRGRILAVGGIKEKVLAAHRMGIKTIILPKENKKDIDEIPSQVRKELKFVLIDNAKEALLYAFVKEKQ